MQSTNDGDSGVLCPLLLLAEVQLDRSTVCKNRDLRASLVVFSDTFRRGVCKNVARYFNT